ncbi:hypothetical protein B7Z28_00565 [Candidatus Saccharibacteria bacterium 32-45-3]|nr:MAG: hypothetical protein B7Z28_00565 [Candidatus Saccharibacteria bacterium 32-45-3]
MKMTHGAMKMRNGTSFQGYVNAPYYQLVEMLGEPYTNPDNHKTDVEWIVSTPHGLATIYNYKNGHSYMGESGLTLEVMDEWHVGGKNGESYEWVIQRLSS